jgi:hypothetical protein
MVQIFFSLAVSFASFLVTAVFLYHSQKLGTYKASILPVKTIFLSFLYFSLQSFTPLVIWTFVAAYQGSYIFIAIGAVMIIQYFMLETFVFGWSEKEKIYDAVLCGEPSQNRDEKVRQVFKTAIVTSWIAPFTVWCNNKPSFFEKRKRGLSVMSNYFFQISSAITAACLLVILGIICLLNKCEMNNFSNKTAPMTHCFHHDNKTGNFTNRFYYDHDKNYTYTFLVNDQLFQTNDLIYLDSDFRKISVYERVCGTNEQATDFFFYKVVPVLAGSLSFYFLLILFYILMECSKRKLIYQCLTRNDTVLKDSLSIKFLEIINYVQQLKEKNLEVKFQNWRELDLKFRNEVNGDTCLHFAFQKGLYTDCEQMIIGGGDPFQKNFKSESLHSLIQKPNLSSSKKKQQTWLGETFFQNMEFIEDTKDMRGIAFISDVEGKIRWSMEMKDEDDIVIANCMMKEASLMIERSDNIKKDQILSKELHNLKLYATTLKSSFQDLKHLILEKNPVSCKSIWKTPPLHSAIKQFNIKMYDVLCLLGVNPEAKNTDSLTPLQMAMKQFHIDLSDEERKGSIDHPFIWKILVRGGTKFVRTKDMNYIIKNFPPKDSHEKLPTKHAEPLFLHAVHSDNYDECKSYKMNVKYFLNLGCKLSASPNSGKMTVLHLAAQHQTADCLSQLLVNIY